MSTNCSSEAKCSSTDHSSPHTLPSSNHPRRGEATGILEKQLTECPWRNGSKWHYVDPEQHGSASPSRVGWLSGCGSRQLLQDCLQLQRVTWGHVPLLVQPTSGTEEGRGIKAGCHYGSLWSTWWAIFPPELVDGWTEALSGLPRRSVSSSVQPCFLPIPFIGIDAYETSCTQTLAQVLLPENPTCGKQTSSRNRQT